MLLINNNKFIKKDMSVNNALTKKIIFTFRYLNTTSTTFRKECLNNVFINNLRWGKNIVDAEDKYKEENI